MNPFQYPVTCDVCGGEGVGTVRTAGAAWMEGSFISHTDPRVCAENLRLKRLEREKRKSESQAQDAYLGTGSA